ncbi:RCC1 domain-containing protein [Streptomyces solaniscabiei]|nr:CAP domain-containing protein [Streptomyces solaniscabiei]
MVNKERTDRGLPPLVMDARLRMEARWHALDAARLQWWPATDTDPADPHANPERGDDKDRIRATGMCHIPTFPCGENTYAGAYSGSPQVKGSISAHGAVIGVDSDPRAFSWMRSDPHRKNLLNPAWNFTGVGVVLGVAADEWASLGLQGAIFVQTFADCSEPDHTTMGLPWTWGINAAGQLGDAGNSGPQRPYPAETEFFLGKTVAVSGGGPHVLALTDSGDVWAWGMTGMQLGNPGLSKAPVPVKIQGLTDVKAISAGHMHSLALKSDGTVWAWGGNNFGELGLGDAAPSGHPKQVPLTRSAISISAGQYHSLAVLDDGTVWAWGANFAGQLGDGGDSAQNSPRKVPFGLISGFVFQEVSAGGWHSLALDQGGNVWGWGSNDFGQVGHGGALTYTRSPVPIGLNALSISAGMDHSLAVTLNQEVAVWGRNTWGQLGDGGGSDSPQPNIIQGIDDVTAVSAGQKHSLALRNNGTVWAWGFNEFGELGDKTTTMRNAPVPVSEGEQSTFGPAVAIAAGYGHSVAVKR